MVVGWLLGRRDMSELMWSWQQRDNVLSTCVDAAAAGTQYVCRQRSSFAVSASAASCVQFPTPSSVNNCLLTANTDSCQTHTQPTADVMPQRVQAGSTDIWQLTTPTSPLQSVPAQQCVQHCVQANNTVDLQQADMQLPSSPATIEQ